MRPLAHLRSRGSRSGYRFLIFHLRFRACRCLGRFVGFVVLRKSRTVKAVQPPQLQGYVFIDRAGVGFLLGDAEFRKPLEDLVSLDFQFPRQLVDANLLHR
jgi:hypothetical protein